MKAIIDGLRYDTERAKEVAWYSNGRLPGDFHRVEETLYRTPKGNWFLHGEGGALTDYREPSGDGWRGGSSIQPLTGEEAMGWLEEHGKVSVLERYFADEIEDA